MKTLPSVADGKLIALAPEMHDLILAINKQVIKCAKRQCNLDHYPEEWAPLKKQLNEIVLKLT